MDELGQLLRETLAQRHLMISRETTADDIPGWDSLSHLFVVMEIEMRFGIAVSAEEIGQLPNIGSLCDLIAMRRKVAQ